MRLTQAAPDIALHPTRRLGEILLSRNIISSAALQNALDLQRLHHDKLGHILLAEGQITAQQLYQALALHYDLPFLHLDNKPVQSALQHPDELETYIQLQAIPIGQSGSTVTIATANPGESLHTWAQNRYGDYTLIITTQRDIYSYLNRYYSTALDTRSRLHLLNLMPEKSAGALFHTNRYKAWLLLLSIVGVIGWLFPEGGFLAFLLVTNLFYMCTIAFKLMLFFHGRKTQPGTTVPVHALAEMAENSLPVYTVLIPLYDEAESLQRLFTALEAIDYPKARLDIKLIVEQDDIKTIEAVRRLRPPGHYELIYVPYSLPQTKPKACNYALRFARGKYVTIYDAEDAPDPLQLRKAVYWFQQQPPHIACLQARLNYYNRNDSILTRLFAIEYALWFDFMLPGLRKLGIPIPLGGTSNHITRRALEEAGEWDPFNVTEDADLGIRLALHGYETDMLDSLTLEEAPGALGIWMNQRTRWVRGYMQTWLVHMRRPAVLWRELSPIAFWGFQFFIGAPCLVFLLTPFVWLLGALWITGIIQLPASALSEFCVMLAFANLGGGFASHFFFAVCVTQRYQWKRMFSALLLFPGYWLLHSIASFRALKQLWVNPSFWEKTPHGLCRAPSPYFKSANKDSRP